ncbi:MAG: glycosyltransferase family 2 protein [Candidatus Daviesbacteria bacterium]|nr:MAG: glycosyltransferase family 2 protein [Candidatus Daviesbacteria bacterium]
MSVSVIIPAFNEETAIGDCLRSLQQQTLADQEIIVVDDGSTDKTREIVRQFPVKLLQQSHLGPGRARNLGAKVAKGEILVFVDADMTFDKKFLEKLTLPIIKNETIGTFSKEEQVSNKDNIWSKCWNLNKGLPFDRMHPRNYPDIQPVFRAILKKEFERAGGFQPIGYIDDHTLAEQLRVLATVAPGAIFYHQNPGSLGEVFRQARWIGKSEYKRRKIKNELIMKIISLVRYNPLFSLVNGMVGSIKIASFTYLIFKIVYDLAIEISLLRSFLGEQANK